MRIAPLACFLLALTLSTVSARPPVEPPADETKPTLQAEPLAKLKSAVLCLQVTRGKEVRTGTAFLIDDHGAAVTSLKLIDGAPQATALFPSLNLQVPVTQIIALDRNLNLALVRIPLDDKAMKGPPPRGLKLAAEAPAAGKPVYAVGASKSTPLAISPGRVKTTLQAQNIPSSIRLVKMPADDSTLIQTDCPRDDTALGGPLVDSAADVVGINLGPSFDGKSAYFALAAAHLAELVKSTSPDRPFDEVWGPDSSPSKPDADAPKTTPASKATPTKPVNAQQIMVSSKRFLDYAKCSHCSGTGSITEKVQTGRKKRINNKYGPDVYDPIFKEKTRDCEACDGLGIAPTKVVWRYGGEFAADLDTAPTDDPKWPDYRTQTTARLRDIASMGLAKWRTRLNQDARTKLTSNEVPTGQPFLIVGELKEDRAVNDETGRQCRIEMGKMTVIVQNTRIIDATEGNIVLVGGILERRDVQNGDFVPVLRNGFVITAR